MTRDYWNQLTDEQKWERFNELQIETDKVWDVVDQIPSLSFFGDTTDEILEQKLNWLNEAKEHDTDMGW